MPIQIRTEKEEDHEAVYQLVARAFQQDFESKLVEKLHKGPTFIADLSLVAEEEGSLLGYVLFSRIHIAYTYNTLALAPLAVDPPHQQRGIGSLLVEQGLEQARRLGHSSAIVLGSPHYYSRFGFRKASEWDIHCPFEVPEEAFMAIELQPDSLSGKAGTVEYPLAFTQM